MYSPFPDVIYHYTKGEAFKSITESSPEEWSNITASFNDENTWGKDRFDDPDYLGRRLVVESELRTEFLKLGGKPQLQNPIYFTLGRNLPFEEKHHGTLRGYLIHLSEIPEGSVTFTYGDSLLSFNSEYRQQSPKAYEHHFCGQLYLKNEIQALVSHKDFPKDSLRIEVQLWEKPTHFKVIELSR